jgi:glutamine synthetase
VIVLQDTEGFFSSLPSEYAHLLSQSIPESIEDAAKEIEKKKVWATILAICVLEKYYKEKRGHWNLIVKKAKKYLKKAGVKDVEKEIKDAMSVV